MTGSMQIIVTYLDEMTCKMVRVSHLLIQKYEIIHITWNRVWIPLLRRYQVHNYITTSEKKCFREEVSIDTPIVGSYRVMMHDSKSNQYIEDRSVSLKILVFSDASQHNLVDTTGSTRGKFHFTAADNGVHDICLTVQAAGWFNSRVVIS